GASRKEDRLTPRWRATARQDFEEPPCGCVRKSPTSERVQKRAKSKPRRSVAYLPAIAAAGAGKFWSRPARDYMPLWKIFAPARSQAWYEACSPLAAPSR